MFSVAAAMLWVHIITTVHYDTVAATCSIRNIQNKTQNIKTFETTQKKKSEMDKNNSSFAMLAYSWALNYKNNAETFAID